MHDKKLSSEAIQLRSLLEQAMKSNPDLIEHVIHNKNSIIERLKADKAHMLIVFKEISQRYNDLSDNLENREIDIQNYVNEIKSLKTSLKVSQDIVAKQNGILQNIKTEHIKIKAEKEKVELYLKAQNKELEDSKVRIAIVTLEQSNSFSGKLNELIDKLPKNFIRHFIKLLISRTAIKYTIFLAFCFLFCVSIIGWTAILSMFKIIIAIFT